MLCAQKKNKLRYKKMPQFHECNIMRSCTEAESEGFSNDICHGEWCITRDAGRGVRSHG
jgi:hypothetical protein